MQVELIKTDILLPYQKNAKQHPDEQVLRIAGSIKEFGFRQPIIIDKDNNVVAGHGRLLAAKHLGIEEVPCIKITDLSEEQIKAFRLADNKTSESNWDYIVLQEELESISIDMTQFGFEDIHLDGFFDDEPENNGAEQEKQPTFRIIAICENQLNYDKVLAFLADNGIEYQEL